MYLAFRLGCKDAYVGESFEDFRIQFHRAVSVGGGRRLSSVVLRVELIWEYFTDMLPSIDDENGSYR